MIFDVTEKLIINPKARNWCTMPYPGHPHGCTNYGKKPTCPPDAPLVQNHFDLDYPHWFAVIAFDLASHKKRMFERHPKWSERQAVCVYYWQGKVRRALRSEAEGFTSELGLGATYTLTPEAMGVNVLETARRIGIPIKVKPTETVFKIALVGFEKVGGEKIGDPDT